MGAYADDRILNTMIQQETANIKEEFIQAINAGVVET